MWILHTAAILGIVALFAVCIGVHVRDPNRLSLRFRITFTWMCMAPVWIDCFIVLSDLWWIVATALAIKVWDDADTYLRGKMS